MYSIVSLYFYYFTGRHPSVLKGCLGEWSVMGRRRAKPVACKKVLYNIERIVLS